MCPPLEHLGREINRENLIPDWASRELMDSSQKRGKGQQKVLIGALYRGADNHIGYKAGGNETAQIAVAERGIATTSQNYTMAHSNHMGLQFFFALKWQNLHMDDVDENSSSEDLTYRAINRRTQEQEHGPPDATEPASTANP